jgi:hypothetical protein
VSVVETTTDAAVAIGWRCNARWIASGRRRPAELLDPLRVGRREVEQAACRARRLPRAGIDRLGEELEPRLPVAGVADAIQQLVA